VRIKIETVSLDSTSMAPSLDGPLVVELGRSDPTQPAAAAQIKSRLGQLPLCSSLTAAPTSTPRRTILHPRRTAAKLQKWHTDRALVQPQSIW
jgi:hypothetical protein